MGNEPPSILYTAIDWPYSEPVLVHTGMVPSASSAVKTGRCGVTLTRPFLLEGVPPASAFRPPLNECTPGASPPTPLPCHALRLPRRLRQAALVRRDRLYATTTPPHTHANGFALVGLPLLVPWYRSCPCAFLLPWPAVRLIGLTCTSIHKVLTMYQE